MISLKDHKVYNVHETWIYCSLHCIINSHIFSNFLHPDCNNDALPRLNQILNILVVMSSVFLHDETKNDATWWSKNVLEATTLEEEKCFWRSKRETFLFQIVDT